MKEFKIPCAVLSSELDKEKAKKLHDKFIELGAVYCEDFECYNDWKYCGIDYEKDTIKFDNLAYYSRDDIIDEVTLYTYGEVMAFGKQEEDPVQYCIEEYVPVEDDDDGWIKWEGGDCPVEDRTNIKYQCRDGHTSIREAFELDWDHTGEWCGWEIVAYKILTNPLAESTEDATYTQVPPEGKSSSESIVGASGGVNEFTASKEYTIYQKGSVIFKGDKEYLTKLRDVINEVLNND